MKFRIDLKIFILILLFLITNQIKIYAMIMLFAIIHELGHLIAGILLGMKPEKIEIKVFGVSISFDVKKEDYNIKIKKGNLLEVKKIFVALAGPLTNVFIMIIFISNIFDISYYDKILIIFSNMTLILFNILPIYPLDGGRILKGIFYILKGKYKAEEYIYHISYITLIILTAISSITLLYFKNIAIFIAIIFLWGLQIKENAIYQNRRKLYEAIRMELKHNDYKNVKFPIENKTN